MCRAPVRDVVAVDGRHDDVLELHLRGSLCDAECLERIDRIGRLAGVDVAVAARACARVAEDLERRRAAAPALGDVRAAGFLADRVQREAVDELLDVEVFAVARRRANLHPLGTARTLGDGQRRLHALQCSYALCANSPCTGCAHRPMPSSAGNSSSSRPKTVSIAWTAWGRTASTVTSPPVSRAIVVNIASS